MLDNKVNTTAFLQAQLMKLLIFIHQKFKWFVMDESGEIQFQQQVIDNARGVFGLGQSTLGARHAKFVMRVLFRFNVKIPD